MISDSHSLPDDLFQHHEKIDGTGCLVHITGEQMRLWSRLCAMVDVFDTMTCDWPHRKMVDVDYVLDVLKQKAGNHLNKEMVKRWIKLMSLK